ncbi:MAG: P1 family peptidase, partial [Acidimicrobiales bacterium]
MITDVPGVRVGHWTDEAGQTGCTVVLLPENTVASGEVRGGAPGTREWALLAPERTVSRVDAVVLAGGSAFGLAACDGVVRWCEERGIGFPTPAGPVPIVVGAVLYDLLVGDPSARPTAASGYAACVAAVGAAGAPMGRVGAGMGATVAKWQGLAYARPAGIASVSRRHGDLVVAALVAVNAFGDLRAPREASSFPGAPSAVAEAAVDGAAGWGMN